MTAKRLIPLVCSTLVLGLSLLGVMSCQQEQSGKANPYTDVPVFGNSFEEFSPVLCKVGDLEITQNQLDLRYEELPRSLKARYSGKDWEKRFLRYMVDEVLLYEEALRRELYNDPEVAQHLISQRRSVLKNALRSRSLLKDLQPTEEQIRVHYGRNKTNYTRQGTLHARTIVCVDKEKAFEAYDRIRQGGRSGHWARVVADFSTNFESAKLAGDLGWFNKGGFSPALPYAKEFSEKIWDWDMTLHEPVIIGGEWHVIEILGREWERPLTLEESRDRILKELTPILQEETVEAFLRQAKQNTVIEFFGSYRPGDGRNPKELFEMAWYAKTPEQKIDLYKLLIEDYPTNELADDALFMIANVYLDTWYDLPFAARYLERLLREYPDSEFSEQAQYILDNMGKTDFRAPKSIEELRQIGSGG